MASLRAVLGFCSGLATVACFDSDEKFQAGTTTSGSTTGTTGTDPTTSTTTSGTTAMEGGTCRDAITCVQECIVEVITEMAEEPDLSCFIECIEVLTIVEAKELLEYVQCVSVLCEAEMKCEEDETTGSSSSGDGSGDGSSSTSTTGPTEPPPLLGECLTCVFDKLPRESTDPELGNCQELAMECT
jgi:hypothetical protein